MHKGFAQQTDSGWDYIGLPGDGVVACSVGRLDAGAEQQQKHVETQQADIGQLRAQPEPMVSHDGEQGFIEPGLLGRTGKKLTRRPIGVALRRQVLIQISEPDNGCNRQVLGQGIGRVIVERLQDGMEGPPLIEPIQLVQCAVEHVLIRYAPGGIDEYRIHAIIATEQARGSNGSGLGLSIVKRIAELHGAGIVLGEGLNGKGLRVKVVVAPA
jgi:hypothetical protein